MHQKKIITSGKKISEAEKALIMIHGRGGSAEDILSLSTHLDVKDFALLAPQATNHSWYPQSFLAVPAQNEPWLSSALQVLNDTVIELIANGIGKENIFFLGFSQGACLTLEYVSRNATKYAGVVAFTGGLIGDKIYTDNYSGDFNNTPVFICTSNPDPHVPVERVQSTSVILKDMNADVTLNIYNNMGHTISQEEINLVNEIIFNVK
ncbi:alpha/beta hydrolase [Lacibacter sediminis]|uniref:Dienelactone hydrolase family protein n=1 Tax=Lacibacter sediminis TaxID=2760713 RepID=A0A7G5XK77_9BACT|nr:dienelactone hydrolase family protein [Lacibacter sediminis]QNA45880.1 dienelactone hydrolase family protein [Lacibacter sediminis]